MMTKSQFAKWVVEDFAKKSLHWDNYKYDDDPEMAKDLVVHVNESGSLGIALEFLGLIDSKEIEEYVSSRDGHFISRIYGGKNRNSDEAIYQYLSVREMLEILPDDDQIVVIDGVQELKNSTILCTGCGRITQEYGYCEDDGSPYCERCWDRHVRKCDSCLNSED